MNTWTLEQRKDAARVWVERTCVEGKATMGEDIKNSLIRQYASSAVTSFFGMIINMQCELLQLKADYAASISLLD